MSRLHGMCACTVLGLVLAFGSTEAQQAEAEATEADGTGSLVTRTSCLREIAWEEVAGDHPVRLLRHDGSSVSGHIRSRSYHLIVLEPDLEGSERVTVADTDIAGVAYWTKGPWKSQILKGASIGFVAGCAIGFLVATMTYEEPDPDAFLEFDRGFTQGMYASFGAAGGAVLGALIGAAMSGEGAPTQREVHCSPLREESP